MVCTVVTRQTLTYVVVMSMNYAVFLAQKAIQSFSYFEKVSCIQPKLIKNLESGLSMPVIINSVSTELWF